MFTLADRVQETCAAPGTGIVTLLGAVTQYQSFSAGIGANNTTYYTIADQTGSNWEVGLGTIGATGLTLIRTTVLASSNAGSIVNFSVGTQNIWCDYPASKAVYGTGTTLVAPSGAILPMANGGTGVTSSGICRAWARWTGSTGAILASFNVSSTTRTATGTYTVAFTSALTDANYSWSGFSQATGGSQIITGNNTPTAPTASNLFVQTFNANVALVDPTTCGVIVFR